MIGVEGKHPIDREVLKDLYVAKRYSAPRIADELGVPRHAVHVQLERFGIAKRRGRPLDDDAFDRLKPGRSVRLRLDTSRGNYHENIHKKARRRGYKVAVRKLADGLVSVRRLPVPKSPSDDDRRVREVKRLYYAEKWRVAAIARHLGLSKTHVYRIMRAANMQLKIRGKAEPVRPINKKTLNALYLNRRWSVPAIAAEMGVEERDVVHELDRHGIWPQARLPSRFDYPGIEALGPWEEMTVPGEKREPTSKLRREAKWHNVRIAARRTDDGQYRLIRLPFVTRDSIRELLEAGIPLTRAAKVLRADPDTINRILKRSRTGKMDAETKSNRHD